MISITQTRRAWRLKSLVSLAFWEKQSCWIEDRWERFRRLLNSSWWDEILLASGFYCLGANQMFFNGLDSIRLHEIPFVQAFIIGVMIHRLTQRVARETQDTPFVRLWAPRVGTVLGLTAFIAVFGIGYKAAALIWSQIAPGFQFLAQYSIPAWRSMWNGANEFQPPLPVDESMRLCEVVEEGAVTV